MAAKKQSHFPPGDVAAGRLPLLIQAVITRLNGLGIKREACAGGMGKEKKGKWRSEYEQDILYIHMELSKNK